MKALKNYWKIKTFVEVKENKPQVYNDLNVAIDEVVRLKNILPDQYYECTACDEFGEEL